LIVGKPDVQAAIGDLKMQRSPESNALQAVFHVERTGKPYSVLGHLFVYHKGNDGKEELVGQISNAHIFPEVNKRLFEVTLTKEVSGGSLRVVMKHYDPEQNLTYAERSFSLE